ncbi:B9 domain-containing protein [Gaertneriomyces semiglobifer]|nr:B9 domain-containing protein [Gaertneriomyces semiglobifer]
MASTFFSVILNGQIESAHFPRHDNLYCKFSFLHGPDWVVISGLEEGITQMSLATPSSAFSTASYPPTKLTKSCIWNFPLEIAYKSTNAFGWPQLVLSVYGTDLFGRDVIRGYGSLRIPITPGIHTLYVPMFVPLASTPLNGFLSWVTGRLPEFLDSRFVARNEGREVVRVRSQGTVKVQLNVGTKDMERFGYVVNRKLKGDP